jgi:HK97 family phage major capsid protein
MQTLSVRGLFSPATTGSNMVEFPRETSTDSDIEASPQYSSPNTENVAKKESAMTFELANAPVVTIAHWVPASRQVLSDAPLLASYIDGRLVYGVKLNEEEQVLNGDGTGGNLTGLITEAAAYAGAVSGDTTMDTLIRAVAQVNSVGIYTATGVVLNPTDITALLLLKDGEQRYMFDSVAAIESKLQVRIASSKQQAAGTFLAGDFLRGAQLFDREDATVRVAEQHADFFVKNMVAVLAEERLALAIYNGTAFVTGNL